ncbi:taurine ABC transporter permease [Kiloniella spongiae]|uniref:Taurine ABC transporter permease n=1 Tax=Kiloniella spongiae TaxID=1489064 RepID=A0A0H2MBL6_9PROT|nr:ABC transporter permease [Kiloniella spongiae]KLN59586.1 taurine ABC transporter permease [Kiloniella spongiae]
MIVLMIYVAIFVLAYIAYHFIVGKSVSNLGFNARKTVTFGDESAVTPNRSASVISIISIFVIWGAFTGSQISPIHVPGPFIGDTSFLYTATNAQNQTSDAKVFIRVSRVGEDAGIPETSDESQNGFARDDALKVAAWRSGLIRVQKNDEGGKEEGYRVTAINGHPIAPLQSVGVEDGVVNMTAKGSLSFVPYKGWQMEPIWLPAPEAIVTRLFEIIQDGYQGVALSENIGWSLFRVIVGFALGSLVGIPLGYAMGLNNWFRGWFDPIVEFMRPIPPLALIPLVIIWFGIWEQGKISLLFLAALWIMTISARAGVSGVNISKVHAAYSLGASKLQILLHVIIPNSLPEIFTGARVAMGVCWGTVVAAELVAAEKGAGKMIIAASKFQQTDIVIMGIILIGIIGFGIDILMRMAEKVLVPWKGKG